MRFAYQCVKINGCPVKVVSYRKHDFWEGVSATQNNSVEYICDYLKAHELIYSAASKQLENRIENAKTPYELAKASTKYYEYLDNLLYRRIAILFNEFYRLFWKTDNTSLSLINDSILAIKKELLPGSWIQLKKSFADLFHR